ncbi:MAG: signal recognition particle protein [Cyanobacteriota bacterium]|jgi:signal recognition particle subunit SRP54
MFEELSSKFEAALRTFKGHNKISDENIVPALNEVKRALVEADVNLNVVNEFLRELKDKAIGIEVVKGITPEQKFIEVVHNKLVEIMGEGIEDLSLSNKSSTILLVGLQGAGKTTAAAKLALYLKQKKNRVMLVAADTFRPAAKEQLKTLGQQIGVDVFTGLEDQTSIEIARAGVEIGTQSGFDVIIIDTAGRLYVDDKLMNEIVLIKNELAPNEVLLVVDAMIGQEAASLARVFNEKIGITGSILTKMDGDSRGGAALSIKKVSGKSVKFVGTGEKVEALEPFYPKRIAGRILGMGDVLTLVDKAQKEIEIEDVLSMQKKFEEASFDFTDFLKQMRMIKRMGSISGIMKLIPGMGKIDDSALKAGEEQLKIIQSMIDSMTKEERTNPQLLLKSQQRRKRVALGSGHNQGQVDKVVQDFEKMRAMMQNLVKGDFSGIQSKLRINNLKSENTSLKKESPNQNFLKKKESKKRKGFFEL